VLQQQAWEPQLRLGRNGNDSSNRGNSSSKKAMISNTAPGAAFFLSSLLEAVWPLHSRGGTAAAAALAAMAAVVAALRALSKQQ
jgi:hypothetical protein